MRFPFHIGQSLEDKDLLDMLLQAQFILSLAKFFSIRVIVIIIDEGSLESPASAEQLPMLMSRQNVYIQTPSLQFFQKKSLGASQFCHLSQVLVVDEAGSHNMLDSSCFHRGIHWVALDDIKEDLQGNQLRLDSNFYTFSTKDNTMREWYSLKGNLFNGHFGQWDKASGELVIPIASKWNRRKNFEGISLKVSTLPFARLVIPAKGTDGSERKFIGQVPAMLDFLLEQHNASVQWVYPEHKVFGTKLENGTWKGLIGMLQSRQVDMVATAMAVTKQRAEVTNSKDSLS